MQANDPVVQHDLHTASAIRWGAVAIAVGIVMFFFLRPPWSLAGKAHLVGYAVCHQLPSHSFHLGGRQLPLCARCTGIYLGTFWTLIGLTVWHRDRPGKMPPPSVLTVLVVFIVLMGFDGVNSYLASFFPGLPHLYEPQNVLRLTTGLLAGIALAVIALPLFHATVWRAPTQRAILPDMHSLLPFVALAVVLIPVVSTEIPALFFPIALSSTAGVIMLLSTVNSVLAAVLLRWENRAERWTEAMLPLIVGLGFALLEISAMDTFRAWLTATLGLPF